jgi:LuxR family maltose regulon positive regulatory protein
MCYAGQPCRRAHTPRTFVYLFNKQRTFSADPRPAVMVPSLLTTKLYVPPVLPTFVPRPRITERLSIGLAGRLTLITAPAGFGKTTAVSAWLHPQSEAGVAYPFILHPERVVWVSLDAADNDLASFWAYIFAALETLIPEIGILRQAVYQAPPLPIEALLTMLINTLSPLSHETVLVLDDYHAIVAPEIHRAIQFLLEHLPPRLHLLIMSRSMPPLSLSRLRARGLLTEIDTADLRFSADEAAQFLTKVMHLPLSNTEIAALDARTEGWITGLHLAALAMRSRGDCASFIRAFTGSNRFVLEYLAEEVLARQPGHVQTFLLQTSILDRMCGGLCDAIRGVGEWEIGDRGNTPASNLQLRTPNRQAYSQLLLEQLERNNLFIIPLDDERCWFRYHPLFVEALRHRLHHGATPQEVTALHLRASRWFERQGLAPEAVQHALAAEDWDRAIDLIGQHGLLVAVGGDVDMAGSWLAALPAHLVDAHPLLSLLRNERQATRAQPEDAPARQLRDGSTGAFELLTERELEVLRLVAAGTSNRAIAARLTVTLGTVKKHLNNIFGKLGVQSRTQALARARELGLL